ncbi:hypothetical protein BVER_03090 [Candidatus Burkholderia verschuerenii]|uniref:Uncharacterized protein n=1 Tax=Candidatus Burkholderia verschuerenii TaxID=242163 RepID=A0A0L0MGW7_9BURK|nr:hypothetical protein [Candidatus Burkholderia verschuerenii]KND61204.1 hypothetical protein BVER_03090 [Candidatus Burkholderia verschuerenii]
MSTPSDGWTVDDTGDWAETFAGLQPTFERLDPYLVWAAVTNFADLGGPPAGFLPIAIELKNGTTPAGTTIGAKAFAEQIANDTFIWMLAMYRSPALADTHFCTAHVTLDFAQRLDPALLAQIERFTLGLPVVSGFASRMQPDKPAQPDMTPVASNPDFKSKVVTVCDDGIAFLHARFHADIAMIKTRVRCFWNQDDDPATPAAGLGYGREFLEADMDNLMTTARGVGGFDENAAYRAADYTAVASYWTHGTSMLDLAAGLDRVFPPPAPSPQPHLPSVDALIGVQFRLPGRTIRDTSGLWLDVQALDALRYVIERERGIAGPNCETFINLSYGYIAGPHDGSSLLEAAMDELVALKACDIFLPARNSNLDRCHGVRIVDPKQQETLRWRVIPDRHTPSFVEIWLATEPDSDPNKTTPEPEIDVSIELPDKTQSPPIPPGSVAVLRRDGDVLCTVVHLGRGARGNQPMILVALAPTVVRGGTRRSAPSGDWIIWLTNGGERRVEAQAWVQRNETPAELPPHGRQSRFDDDLYPLFNRFTERQDVDDAMPNTWILHANGMNSIATGAGPVVAAGYRICDGATARYSTVGVDAPGWTPLKRLGPDLAALTDPRPCCPA